MPFAAMILAAATAQTTPVPPRIEAQIPNFYSQPARCGPLHQSVTRHIQTATGAPRATAQYAVLRKVDGCGVPAPAGYRQDYLLPGAADAPQFRRMKETTKPTR